MPSIELDVDEAARVGRAVRARMKGFAMNQSELVAAAKVSVYTVRRLRRGDAGSYLEANLGKVCLALEWPADAIERIAAGVDPAELGPPDPDPHPDPDLPPLIAQITAQIDALAAELREQFRTQIRTELEGQFAEIRRLIEEAGTKRPSPPAEQND